MKERRWIHSTLDTCALTWDELATKHRSQDSMKKKYGRNSTSDLQNTLFSLKKSFTLSNLLIPRQFINDFRRCYAHRLSLSCCFSLLQSTPTLFTQFSEEKLTRFQLPKYNCFKVKWSETRLWIIVAYAITCGLLYDPDVYLETTVGQITTPTTTITDVRKSDMIHISFSVDTWFSEKYTARFRSALHIKGF